MGGWTYIARCRDDSLYVGSTSYADVQTRIDEHNDARYLGFTSKSRPVVLAWSMWFQDLAEAHEWERQLKGWSRAKKLALIRGDIDRLKAFAKRPSVRTEIFKSRGETPPVVRVTGRNLRRLFDEAQSTGASKVDSLARHPEVRAKRATKDD
jgi:putative endonuclease